MASIARHNNTLAVISGACVAVYQIGSYPRQVYKCEKPAPASSKQPGDEVSDPAQNPSTRDSPASPAKEVVERPEVAEEEKGSNGSSALPQVVDEVSDMTKNPERMGKETSQLDISQGQRPATDRNEESGSDRILSCGFSAQGTYFVACDDFKQITLWKTGPTWTKISTRTVVRRGTSLTFPQKEDVVLVADKSGDVYSFSISRPEEPGKLLLGHVSMLLDMVLLGGDRFIATSDRDEKIRISCYPNAYNIQAFCLGHTDFVSALAYFDEDELLVSGSGDGTLRVWRYKTSSQLAVMDCKEALGLRQGLDKPPTQPVQDAPENIGKTAESLMEGGHGHGNQQEVDVNVRCLACHQSQHLLVATFDGMSEVLVFQLKTESKGAHLALTQKLVLSSPPWDVDLDPQGRLWVLVPSIGKTLQVFQQDETDMMFSPVVASDDPTGILTTVEAVNVDWEFFMDSLSVESPFKILRKARIDNMAEYIEKKKQRMQSQKRTPTEGRADKKESPTEEPESKKSKVS